jgi:hypothetical protein
MAEHSAGKSKPFLIAVVWAVVVVPAAWGVTHTVQSALKIFAAPASSTTAAH